MLPRRVQSVLINVSLFAVFYYFMLKDDEEEESPTTQESNKAELRPTTIQRGQDAAKAVTEGKTMSEGEVIDEKNSEDEGEIPDIIPEDAIFIPLGFARQRPQEFYKGSGPEWQSFLEFSRDRKRGLQLRRKPNSWPRYVH